MNAAEFNALYAVGVPVFAYPGARREDIPSATRLVTRTRSKAQVSASGDAVVWVDGEGAYICLTHVDVVPEDEWEKARAAEAAATPEPPEWGSKEWLESLPRDERWPHTEVVAIHGDRFVNPDYDVALYHLRYAVSEVKRLTAQMADLERGRRILAALQAGGVDNWEGYSDALEAVDE